MPYLLTVSRMDYSARKKRWADPGYSPGVRVIGSREIPLAYPGALVLVDDDGHIRTGAPLLSPKGMLYRGDRLLVACYNEVRAFSRDLSASRSLVNDRWCNDLHSLRPSTNGVLVAVTGVDAAVEFADDGKQLWRWWGAEHGFDTDLRHEPWSLGQDTDHRRYVYPVELQSTHINAIAALDDETFVASLLHADMLISIDRGSGKWSVLLDGVPQPHAVRVIAPGLITYSDTRNGAGVLAQVRGGRAEKRAQVSTDTTWLHDAHFDGERWMLVDGANSRVVHVDADGTTLRVDQFDTEWCLYEVLPWRSPEDDGRP